MNDVNTKMLNYCLSTSGQNDTSCKPFSAINGSAQWLANATQNTTDATGVTTSMCGTTGNLSKATCQSVCTVYPELCSSDIQQKCAAPANRYTTNIDFFEGSQTEHVASPTTPEWWIIFFLFILAIFFAIWKYSHSQCVAGNKKYANWCRQEIFD